MSPFAKYISSTAVYGPCCKSVAGSVTLAIIFPVDEEALSNNVITDDVAGVPIVIECNTPDADLTVVVLLFVLIYE